MWAVYFEYLGKLCETFDCCWESRGLRQAKQLYREISPFRESSDCPPNEWSLNSFVSSFLTPAIALTTRDCGKILLTHHVVRYTELFEVVHLSFGCGVHRLWLHLFAFVYSEPHNRHDGVEPALSVDVVCFPPSSACCLDLDDNRFIRWHVTCFRQRFRKDTSCLVDCTFVSDTKASLL